LPYLSIILHIKLREKEEDYRKDTAMGFYEEISKHYDDIFPAGKPQIQFLSEHAGGLGSNILDIACGTGGYTLALAKSGHDITAIDLDEKMIEGLNGKLKSQDLNVKALQMNMMDIDKLGLKFDMAYCIGNSLVHLESIDHTAGFLKKAKSILKGNGRLILQIINYDRILKFGISSLPAIINEEAGIAFERLYKYDKVQNKIFFKTILKTDKDVYENEIPLLPITSEELAASLSAAGFLDISMYGDFKKSPYDKDGSYALVVVAK
jgi:2-polyprenyl-3-methyl-5-hydroxy-6-metoxy-1,4-benzoquinol methylase